MPERETRGEKVKEKGLEERRTSSKTQDYVKERDGRAAAESRKVYLPKNCV